MGVPRAIWPAVTGAAAIAGVTSAALAAGAARTAITVFAGDPVAAGSAASSGDTGGATYGGALVPPSGALVTERRDVDVDASGEIRLAGVPDGTDAASVQLRGLGEPLAVREQRFVPSETTADDVLLHHNGEQVTVTTPKGELTGTLRAADAQSLVLEVGGALRVLRRDGYVLDIKLPPGAGGPAALVWRVAAKPGKQPVEVTYRTDNFGWSADYIAVLDAGAKAVDFAAWATVKNATNATFDGAELTLVSPADTAQRMITAAGPSASGAATASAVAAAKAAQPTRFTVPGAVKLGAGESVQVELVPPRAGVKVRPVVAFEAMPDPSAQFQAGQGTDCNQFNEQDGGKGEVALELDAPGALPDGKVHLFQRVGGRLDVLTEDALHVANGVARIRLSPSADVTGERRTSNCNYDEAAHTVREKVELTLENHGKQRVTVVAREFMWRWTAWRLDGESPKGEHAGAQTQEYRVDIAPGGKQTITYNVIYAW